MSPAQITFARPLLRRRRLGGGAALAALVAAGAIAVWPGSAADTARADGERLGQAAGELSSAGSSAEVDAALAELDAAVADVRTHAGDEVAGQAADQRDALARAADGFAGMHTTTDGWDAELYEAELDLALDDLTSQAADFREQGPEAQQAFWDGVEDGLAAA